MGRASVVVVVGWLWAGCGLVLDLDPPASNRGLADGEAFDAGGGADAARRDAAPDAADDASRPARPGSCREILEADPAATDGEYEIWPTADGPVRVECEMEDDGGGWTEVVDLSPDEETCIDGWGYTDEGSGCWLERPSCDGEIRSRFFDVPVRGYREVRGRVRGYQHQTPDAFAPPSDGATLDDAYVDGVSITVGTPRRHVWTFAAGLFQPGYDNPNSCPCDGGPAPPGFVGEGWVCETGNDAATYENDPIWYLDDVLWDEDAHTAGCVAPSEWFVAGLEEAASGPIEVRLMVDQCDDNLSITALELMVR